MRPRGCRGGGCGCACLPACSQCLRAHVAGSRRRRRVSHRVSRASPEASDGAVQDGWTRRGRWRERGREREETLGWAACPARRTWQAAGMCERAAPAGSSSSRRRSREEGHCTRWRPRTAARMDWGGTGHTHHAVSSARTAARGPLGAGATRPAGTRAAIVC
jgi:hypothetical protein